MAFLYGRTGRLTAKNGGFRPGQGFKKYVLAAKGADGVPGWLGSGVFYMATLFCL